MKNATRLGRIGMLAVGLSIGVAMTAAPGTASATTDIDISIDGIDIFNGGGSAAAVSGMGDMAIAIGPNADAIAEGGYGDFASAFSTGSAGAVATAGDELAASGNNFDFASAVGNVTAAAAGNPIGAYPSTTGSSFDFASAFGDNGAGSAGTVADAGFNGSGDYASAVGQSAVADAGFSNDPAGPSNFDWASVWGNLFAPTSTVTVASAVGGPLEGGSNDLAVILDPFGILGSTATAGQGYDFDVAGVLGDELHALATGAEFVLHILPFF
jgi:hypothetical protein